MIIYIYIYIYIYINECIMSRESAKSYHLHHTLRRWAKEQHQTEQM